MEATGNERRIVSPNGPDISVPAAVNLKGSGIMN